MRDRTWSEEQAHKAAIVKIRDDWHDGLITLDEKRRRIAEENLFYHGTDKISAATGRPLTDESGPIPVIREPVLVPDREEVTFWWQD